MLARKIGIDLGTNTTLVYVPRKGIVVNEPSVVARELGDEQLVAIGYEAERMLGRTPESLTSYRPLREGVIADFGVTQAMLKHYLNQTMGRLRWMQPDVMISLPAGATSTERKAVIDAVESAGAREAHIILEPVAAALGAEIPVASPAGNLVIDIGGGTTEIAVISLNGLVATNSIRVGGDRLSQTITHHLRRNYNLAVGERTADEVKAKIGSALPLTKEKIMEVKGRDIAGGLPKTVQLSSSEVTEAMQEPLERMVLAIRNVLERTPPELVSDIIDRGMVLTGGGAKLRNMAQYLSKKIGVPANTIENPELAVALGTGVALTHLAEYKQSALFPRS